MSLSSPPGPMNLTYVGKKVFTNEIKLKILREDHFGLCGWTLNPSMRILTRRAKRRTSETEKRYMEGEGAL